MTRPMRAAALEEARREYRRKRFAVQSRRRRITGTVTLAASTSALLLIPGAFFPGAELSPQLVVVALAAPGGLASLFYLLAGPRFAEIDVRTPHHVEPEPERVR